MLHFKTKSHYTFKWRFRYADRCLIEVAVKADSLFYLCFLGQADLVRCYQCGIGLKDWSPEDDVLEEHIRHSSDCSFLKEKLGQDRLNQLKVCRKSIHAKFYKTKVFRKLKE